MSSLLLEGQILEAANGKLRLCIIQPGEGSSGYYSDAVLEKAAPLFEGAPMHMDHLPPGGNRQGSGTSTYVGDILPGVIYDRNGAKGPGIYADATYRARFREDVEFWAESEKAGISVHAGGNTTKRAGKTPIVESIDVVSSVDYVVRPGRGGKALAILESEDAMVTPNPEQPPEQPAVTPAPEPQPAPEPAPAPAVATAEMPDWAKELVSQVKEIRDGQAAAVQQVKADAEVASVVSASGLSKPQQDAAIKAMQPAIAGQDAERAKAIAEAYIGGLKESIAAAPRPPAALGVFTEGKPAGSQQDEHDKAIYEAAQKAFGNLLGVDPEKVRL